MGWSDTACVMYPPTSARRTRLAGTGTTEATNTTALAAGCMATIVNDTDAPIRYDFGAATAPGCAVTAPVIGPYMRLDWTVGPLDCFVSIEAADGAAAYAAHVWQSSPSQ